jgi:membrane-associated phospholipid phosphatase
VTRRHDQPGAAAPRRGDALDASPGSVPDRIAHRAYRHAPVTVAVMVWVVGVVIVGAIIVGCGLLVTHVLVHGPVGRWDEGVEDWFVRQRTSPLNAITSVGTTIGSTVTVLVVAVVAVVVLAFRRLWRELGLIVAALTLEVGVFLFTTIVVNRPRPTVPQLDKSPPTSSYPSGHTAAAIALWISLAIVITMHVRNGFVRVVVWIVAVGLPVFIGLSRLYRGMHHPTDVAGGLVLGAGAVVTALIAVRAASAVAELRGSPRFGDTAAGRKRTGVRS